MKIVRWMDIAHILAVGGALTGCAIGNGRICGPQTPLAYCDREAYQELLHPTPLSDYWEMAGISSEARRQEWVDCGGAENGRYVVPTEGFNDEEVMGARRKKFDQLQICMLKRGYRYTGSCEGSIRHMYPACKAQ